MIRNGLILFCFVWAMNPAHTYAQPRVLILGDSHMVGQFGEAFHRKLLDFHKYEIMSVAIGGSGSANFLQPLYNFCCGFVVRHICPDDSLDKNGKTYWNEGTYLLTNERIVAEYNSNIDTLLSRYKPHMVVIELGSNLINAHQELLQRVHRYAPLAAVCWIGPYARILANYRIREIVRVCQPLSNRCIMVRSDDIIGHDSLMTYHFVGAQAVRWADSIAARVDRVFTCVAGRGMMYNRMQRLNQLALRLCGSVMYGLINPVIRLCPAEGWISSAWLQKTVYRHKES